MTITYKQKCVRCNKNYVIATGRSRYILCYDCQKTELEGKISDPKMKKLFSLPERYYATNSFLRNIKINYLRYGNLTDNQITAFKKVAKEIRTSKADTKPK